MEKIAKLKKILIKKSEIAMLIMIRAIMMITTMMMYAIFCRTGYTIKINVISKKKKQNLF